MSQKKNILSLAGKEAESYLGREMVFAIVWKQQEKERREIREWLTKVGMLVINKESAIAISPILFLPFPVLSR
jgi:hypothetical protein